MEDVVSEHAAIIWAHPVRTEWAEQLQQTLDRPTDILYDTNPVPSADPQQRWAVCVRVLEHLAATGATHGVWMQDDAIVCRDFLASLDAARAAAGPRTLISPYTGTGRPDQRAATRALDRATADGLSWLSLRSLYWGVAVSLPLEHVEAILSIGSRPVFRRSPSDYRVGVVARDYLGLRTWYTVPSLVEHRDVDSLVGHDVPGQERKAHRFAGADVSGLSVAWDKMPAADITRLGQLNHRVAQTGHRR